MSVIAGPVAMSNKKLTAAMIKNIKTINQRLPSSLRWLLTISATTESFIF
ncbi:Uncharacterised protein [Mycobacteroides abscessus subsp. massiliense]|nr:Uncharacterised protein [Mycobacteroides abscessus subsp. massiliense]